MTEAAGNATYQLSIAYDIGFGCDISESKALEYRLSSALLGNPEARKEVYGTFCALTRPFPPEHLPQLAQWLYDEALGGDKVCFEELSTVSSELYNTVETSPMRSRKLCERSGIIFDESFFDTNNLGDVSGLLSAIQESNEEIDCDIGGGMTWLHYAAYGGSLEFAIRLVLELNAPLNARNIKSQTPLWIACLGGTFDIAKFLIEQGADVSIASNHGVTPLHSLSAFQEKHTLEIASLLINHGADVNAQATGGLTPLHYAVRGSMAIREEPTVAILLSHDSNPLINDDDGETPIEAAIVTMRPVYLKHMLCSKHVAKMEPTEVAKLLANCFQSVIGQMRFHRLRQGGAQYWAKIKELVRTLHTKDIVSAYIANHVTGYSPLHDACRWSFDIAQEILLLGPEESHINLVPDKGHGYTPLMQALRKFGIEFVDQLIRAGADPLRRARSGENILHVCVEYNPTLVLWLCGEIAHKADLKTVLNEATFKGETPLHYALMLGNIPTASYLINSGADPRQFHKGLDGNDQFNALESCLNPPNVPGLKLLSSLPDPPDFISSTSGYTLLHHTCAHIYNGTSEPPLFVAPQRVVLLIPGEKRPSPVIFQLFTF
jgi:ankyrin repeat protein